MLHRCPESGEAELLRGEMIDRIVAEALRKRTSSSALARVAARIVRSARGAILDVGCGQGRNAKLLQALGCTVVCADKNPSALRVLLDDPNHPQSRGSPGARGVAPGRLLPVLTDLARAPWPFAPAAFCGIINVHCFLPTVLEHFAQSLRRGGYLFIETIGGYGENYLELPKRGQLIEALKDDFELESYTERKAGPSKADAVSVKLLARRIDGTG